MKIAAHIAVNNLAHSEETNGHKTLGKHLPDQNSNLSYAGTYTSAQVLEDLSSHTTSQECSLQEDHQSNVPHQRAIYQQQGTYFYHAGTNSQQRQTNQSAHTLRYTLGRSGHGATQSQFPIPASLPVPGSICFTDAAISPDTATSTWELYSSNPTTHPWVQFSEHNHVRLKSRAAASSRFKVNS